MRLGLSLGVLTGLQLAAAFASQLVVLRVVGAGALTDAFVIAQTLPLLVVAIFASPMQMVWMPRLSLQTEPHQWQTEQRLAQGQMLWLSSGATVPLALTAMWWLPWLFPGLPAASHALAIELSWIFLAGAAFNAHSLLLATALRAQRRFLLPELVAALGSLIALAAAFWVVPRSGVLGATWLLAGRACAVWLALFIAGGRPLPRPLAATRSRAHWVALMPVLAGASLYKLSPLVDRYWGSMAPAGGLTVLALAQTGIGALAQVLERAIAVPALPRMAPLVQQGQHIALWTLVRGSVLRIALVCAACAAVLLALAPWWNEGLQWMMRMSLASADQAWWLCLALIGFLFVSAAGGLPVAAFIALGDTRTPIVISSIVFFVGVLLKSLGFLAGGLLGLAVAASLAYLVNFGIVTLLLRKRLHDAAA